MNGKLGIFLMEMVCKSDENRSEPCRGKLNHRTVALLFKTFCFVESQFPLWIKQNKKLQNLFEKLNLNTNFAHESDWINWKFRCSLHAKMFRYFMHPHEFADFWVWNAHSNVMSALAANIFVQFVMCVLLQVNSLQMKQSTRCIFIKTMSVI